MFAGDRLARLRALVARLEQLPASQRREWMLAEARARTVDVGTDPPIAGPEESGVAFGADGVLWLEDSPIDHLTAAVESGGDAKSARWRQGLRG